MKSPTGHQRRGDVLSFARELLDFMRGRKRYWLAPLLCVMILLGALLIFTSGSVIAPFNYALR
jgi:hypothetical protein